MYQLLSGIHVETVLLCICIACVLLIAVVIALIAVSVAKKSKKKKAAISEEKAVEPVEPISEPTPVEEKPAEEPDVLNEEPAAQQPVVSSERQEEPEEDAESEETTEEVPEEISEEPVATTETIEEPEEATDEPASDGKKIVGKMEICNSNLGGYAYMLRANNGQLLYESKTYKDYKNCEEAARSFVEAVKVGMFSVRVDKFKRYKFILKSPTSSMLMYVGESFDNERSCLRNIESVRRFAVDCVFVDTTSKDFKADFTYYTISDEAKEKVEKGSDVVGRWAIEREDEEDKKSPYVFLLYANNGQLLYESRDYSSYTACKNGLLTFRVAVQEGQFIIDPDKAGRYKFILRNVSKKSLMEYIGQSYATKRACAEGIDSIYRFAIVSPVDQL